MKYFTSILPMVKTWPIIVAWSLQAVQISFNAMVYHLYLLICLRRIASVILSEIPLLLKSDCQKWLTKLLSLLDTIGFGNLCRWTTSQTKIVTTKWEEKGWRGPTKWSYLLTCSNHQQPLRIESTPSDNGSPSMKSMKISSHILSELGSG